LPGPAFELPFEPAFELEFELALVAMAEG